MTSVAKSHTGHLIAFTNRATLLILLLCAFVFLLPSASFAERDDLFNARLNYEVGKLPWDIVADDFDGNGHIDLVNVNRDYDSVSVALNNGDGTFEDPKWSPPVGNEPWSIDAADLNADGHVDLAVSLMEANNSFDYVSVLLNVGDGSFSAFQHYPVGDDPASVFLVDLGEDSNGDIDIITANGGESNSVSVLFNDGFGSFSLPTNYSVGLDPHSVFAGDLDGDGYDDAVTANRDNGSVTVLFNDRAGSFINRTDYDDITCTPWDVYLGNLTGDPSLDILVLCKDESYLILRENDGTGIFTFRSIHFIGNSNSVSLVVGDADLDGYKDILCSSWGDSQLLVILYYNNATASYEKVEIPIPGGARSFVLADLEFGKPGSTNIAAVVPGEDLVSILLSDTPPAISIIEPDGANDTAEFEYRIEWEDSDPDSDATVQLYYYRAGSPMSAIELGTFSEDDGDDYYLWNVSSINKGDYYIRAVISDDFSSMTVDSTGPITVVKKSPPPDGGQPEPTDVSLGLIIVAIVGGVLTAVVLYLVLKKKEKPPEQDYYRMQG